MSFRRYIVYALTLATINPVWVALVWAQPHGGWVKYSPGQLQLALKVLGTGPEARVSGRLRDRTRFDGSVQQIEAGRVLLLDPRSTAVLPISYLDIKELRGENASTGVRFAARVNQRENLGVVDLSSANSSDYHCCHPKHEWIAITAVLSTLVIIIVVFTPKT